MNASFLKLTPTVLLAALSTIQMMAQEQLENRVSKLESQMRQVRTETALGTYTALTAPGRPQNDGSGLFVTGDLLVWKLYEGSAYYPVTDSTYTFKSPTHKSYLQAPLVNSNQIVEVNYHALRFDWDVGFRAGVGFKSDHDNWDYSLTYTQFLTEVSKTHNQDPPANRTRINGRGNLVLTGFLPDTIPTDSTNSIYTRRSVDLYVADLELGRSFFVSKTLSLRPEIGIKSAWIYQKLSQTEQLNFANTFSTDAFENAIILPALSTTQLKGKNDFWGIGPEAGVEMNWYIMDPFSIYAEISGAVLWGRFDVRQKESSSIDLNVNGIGPASTSGVNSSAFNSRLAARDTDLVEHLKCGPHRFVPTVQMALGLAYSTLFFHDRLNLTVKAGYENQYWWRQNYLNGQSITFPDSLLSPITSSGGGLSINGISEAVPPDERFASPDDLGYHGFTFELRVDF